MNKFIIIEDCSPYYIRFTFEGLQDIIELAKSSPTKLIWKTSGYSHENYSIEVADKIISMLPMSDKIKFRNERAALFNTPPGGGCGIHKDGVDHKISFNIPVEILDDFCMTHWYTDEELKDLPIDLVGGYSRNVWKNWLDLKKFNAIKTMSAKPGEMIFFNTDIYHCWTNQNSTNYRKMLTLRTVDRSIYFEEAKKIIFG
jgi:hypothetical protein